MTMNRRKLFIIFALLALVLVAGAVSTVLVARLHELDTYKDQILVEVRKTLARPVTYGKGEITFRFGPAFTFTKVVIGEKDGRSTFATADRVSFGVALLPLLEKKVIIRKMVIERPAVQIVRNSDGTLNVSDLLEEKKEAVDLRLRGIRITDGSVTLTDRAALPEGIVTILVKTDLSIDRLTRGKKTDVDLSTTIVEGKGRSTLSVHGSARLAPGNRPLTESHLDVRVLARNLDAGHYWPYYGRFVPFQRPAGRIDLDSRFDGTAGEFTSKGSVRVAGLRFSYPQVFHAVLAPRDLRFTYEMKRDGREVAVDSLDFLMDGLHVKGRCAVKDIQTKDPRIVAWTAIDPFQLEKFFHYIPFGIIADDPSRFIESYIKGGTFRVDEGRLDGRVSQILHMEKDRNYDILSVKAKALGGAVVDIGGGVPTFNSIKGDLELAGKNFVLRNMSGRFGSSPFTLNGMITDYCMLTPSGYPFSAAFTPQQPDLAWLLGKITDDNLHFSGSSVLRVNGEGQTSAYTISGDWNLGGAAYSVTNVVAKPAGQPNQLSYRLALSMEGLGAFSCQYALPPLSLSLVTRHRPGKEVPSLVEVKTNQFDMAAVAPFLPRYIKYHPKGRMQVTARGEGEAKTFADLPWGGEIVLSGASFRPTAEISPLSNISGSIRFRGNTLETPRLAMMLGSSLVFGKGTLTDFDNPSFAVDFTSPSINTADLGLSGPKGGMKIQKLQGNVSFNDDTLRIRSLTGRVNNTTLTLKGTVEELRAPRVDVTVTSPFLDVDDIQMLAALERPGKERGPAPTPPVIKAAVSADAGKYGKLPFTKLQTVAMYEDRILYLQPLEFGAFGGKVNGRIRADFGSNEQPRFQTNLKAENLSAEQLIQSLGLRLHNEVITGTLSLQADVTARGESAAELKKSLLGNVKLYLEDGSLRRFAVLSKIFSILNVSQLLKFKLPDMVSGGMPYNEMNATLAVRDGVVSSHDLFIDSAAMNISAVGKIDLVKEELNITVGVQPLQTVDKVVSRIPIVGWILTGKDRSLITAYFEAKGKWDDPVVAAIPVKSMARGVFDVFKRVFQLPGKLVTDTGEVIIGK